MAKEDGMAAYIRARVRRAREDSGLSQSELGKAIGKTNVSISDIERGKVGLSSVDLALIARKVGRPLAYFFPTSTRIRVREGELNSDETRLVLAYRNLKYSQLEEVVLKHVEQLADFAKKSELRRFADDVGNVIDIVTDRD